MDGGEAFSDPLLVAATDKPKPARGPALAAAAGDTGYLAWTVGEDDGADIQIATSLDAGRSFQRPRVAFDSDGHSDAPKIAVDDQGTIHLVYGESPDGRFDRYHIRYTRSYDGAETFETPRDISCCIVASTMGRIVRLLQVRSTAAAAAQAGSLSSIQDIRLRSCFPTSSMPCDRS